LHARMKFMSETATFAGGCFWCTEAIFQRLKGVEAVIPGYSGGDTQNSYEEVSQGTTGHAESIQIIFDPKIVSYEELLLVFFKTHDPTSLNKQGADVGPQYRSAIFYHSQEQKDAAEQIIKKLTDEKVFDKPIVTEVSEFKSFFEAEEYHKNYYNNNKNAGYCQVVINPKLAKLEKEFGEKLK